MTQIICVLNICVVGVAADEQSLYARQDTIARCEMTDIVDADLYAPYCAGSDLRRNASPGGRPVERQPESRVLPSELVGFVVELTASEKWLEVIGALQLFGFGFAFLKLDGHGFATEDFAEDEVAHFLCETEDVEARIQTRC